MAAAFAWLGLPLNLISVLVLYVGLIAGDACVRRWQTVTYCTLQVGFTAYLRKRLHRVGHARRLGPAHPLPGV